MTTPDSPYEVVTAPEDLDRLVERSHREPVLLFKHSITCGISAGADEQMRQLLAGAGGGVSCGLIVVQQARPISSAVAERFGIRHESPQVLLLRDGRVVWHASHWNITTGAVRDALQAAAAPL